MLVAFKIPSLTFTKEDVAFLNLVDLGATPAFALTDKQQHALDVRAFITSKCSMQVPDIHKAMLVAGYQFHATTDLDYTELDELSLTAVEVDDNTDYYVNIAGNKLEIPVSKSGNKTVYDKLDATHIFQTSDAEIIKKLDDFVNRRLLLCKKATIGFLAQEDDYLILQENGSFIIY